jgi:hypothetical protein
MNDERIENILRESWNPEPPEGMRERVLRKGRLELNRGSRHALVIPINRWKLALVGLAILTVFLTNVSDYARQKRVTEMLGSESLSDAQQLDFLTQQRMTREMMALADWTSNETKDMQQPQGVD